MLEFLYALVYLVVCIILIFLILIQSSKGSGLQGAFGAGGGSADSFMGAASSATVVVKAAIGFSIAFLLLTISYSFMPHEKKIDSVMNETAAGLMSIDEAQTQDAAAPAGGTEGAGAENSGS